MVRKINRLISLFYSVFVRFNTLELKRITLHNAHNASLEFIWTLVPTIILIFLALPSLYFLYQIELMFYDTIDSNVVLIKVIGNQWFWTYELDVNFTNLDETNIVFDSYLRSFSDLNIGELRLLETDHPLLLPAFTPLRFIITAADVLHSWAVPSLGIKVDACPGRLNQVFSFINREGEFYGQCSEICGIQHGFMPIDIISLN